MSSHQNCTAGWSATRKAHCAGCCRNFTTPNNFDKHLSKGEHLACLDPTTVGLVLNANGLWSTPGEVDVAERFKAVR